jgi:imidazolonepropionase-like amidohydrolase
MLDADMGTVENGKRADLVLVEGQPLDDISVLAEPANIVAVLQAGGVVKDSQGRLA